MWEKISHTSCGTCIVEKKNLEGVEKIELTVRILTWKEVGSLLTEYGKSLHMIGRIMHIISSGYLWGIFV